MKLAMIRVWLGTLVAMAATPAFADSFSFSYIFAEYGTEVSGTFTGDQNGVFVENISNLTLLIDGNVVPGASFTARWDENDGWVNNPILSFERVYNNFLFADSDIAGGDGSGFNIFFMVHSVVWVATAELMSDFVYASANESNPGTWTLTNLSTPTSVPDGGVTAGMLLLALAGLRLLRKTTAA